MLAKELIDRIESRGLLDQEIIEALREQLDQGGTRVTPEAVAKLLVDNGQLTRFQATKLIGELRSDQYPDDEPAEVVAIVEDDLGIVGEEVEVVEVAEAVEVAAVAEAVPVEAMPAEAVAVSAEAVAVPAAEAVAIEAEPVEVAAEPVATPDRPTARPRPAEPVSSWDSFKIYGFIGIIVFLAVFGTLLYFWLSAKDADDVIEQANKLYDQQNYVNAQEQYVSFLENFGEGNQHSSISRTRIVMCELYRGLTVSDTTRPLDLAKERLPTINDEEGLNEERGNVAALLVTISENIKDAAMETTDTPGKEALLKRLDESVLFMDDPNYMTGSMRTTLSGRISGVLEGQARVRRDIQRNKSLDATVGSMKSLLADKKTKQAYDDRFVLLTDFPELENNERLNELILEASDIQHELVEPSTVLPKIVPGVAEQDQLKAIVLTAQKGPPLPGLRDEMYYLRAQGSVLGIDAEKGALVWRRFVGYGQDHSPVRLDGTGGVLLSESGTYEIQKCDGITGKLLWRAKIGEDFTQPLVVRDNVFVSTRAGTTLSLDVKSGETAWSTKIPQPLEVTPGVDSRTGRAYLPGDHSNLYVIDSRTGSSIESYYIGHDRGSIAVPPVPLLGHVFVIENINPESCLVHIFKVDDDGNNIRKVQDTIPLTGNVFVRPTIVQKRRMIVLTDRGQVTVLDVEPTSKKDQVSIVADQVASYDVPTPTQMAVGKSQMWITGTKIGRYELQINTGRVKSDWFKYEGDTFVGEPLSTPDAVIHARVLRKTSGIRVTATDPKEGTEYWRTDIGVPVSMIAKSPNGFHIVNSGGALYELTREAFASGVTQNPIENPGGDNVTVRFESPIAMGNNVVALLNKAAIDQIALYDPSREREKLRVVVLDLQTGIGPNGGGVGAGKGLFMGLNNGRAALFNHRNGSALGNPFQPPTSPTIQVKWTNPVPLPNDPDQVVIADSRKKIYRLRVGDQVSELASKDLPKPFVGPVAGVGQNLFGIVADPDADVLVGHDFGSLKEVVRAKLSGRAAWGPYSAGKYCLVKTEDGQLRGFDAKGKQKFSVAIPAGKSAGQPVVVGEKIVIAGSKGWIVTVDSGSSQIAGQIDLGQPIASTPFVVGNRILVPGLEGVIYFVDVPGV